MNNFVWVVLDLQSNNIIGAFNNEYSARARVVEFIREAYPGGEIEELAIDTGFFTVKEMLDYIQKSNDMDEYELEVKVEKVCVLN